MNDKELARMFLEVICKRDVRHIKHSELERVADGEGVPISKEQILFGLYTGKTIYLNNSLRAKSQKLVALHELAHYYRQEVRLRKFRSEEESEADADKLADQWYEALYGR